MDRSFKPLDQRRVLDYILVGFGLSGSSLAHHLEIQAKTFLVFDDETQQASKVAGGLYNPVVLKRFTLAWDGDKQLEAAVPFYLALEQKLGIKIHRSVSVHRKFSSIEEQNNWFSAMDRPNLAPFLQPNLVKGHQNVLAKYRFGKVEGTGIVNTRKLLTVYSKALKEKGKLRTEPFDYALLEVKSGFVQYKGIRAKNIIFCEGFGMKQNPFFNYLPLEGNKGEYLVIKAPNLKLEEIVKASVFVLPLGNDLYKVGATYERNFENQLPTSAKRAELIGKLADIIDCGYEVVHQIAGVRPTVPDRKPLVGRHPEHENVFICNGFGSRGVLIAPSITKQLVAFIEEGEPLPEEISIRRFSK